MLFRIWTLFKARSLEFFRDKSTFIWNLLFPFFIIIGFSFIFNEDNQTLFKIGIINKNKNSNTVYDDNTGYFKKMKYSDFINFSTVDEGLDKLKHHRIDFLINFQTKQYWVNSSSPNGYIVEKLLYSSKPENKKHSYIKQEIAGFKISYIEWLFPGILGMNMLFTSLFGVGYVIVRYRKNGVLKRLSVTPTNPFEFLTAQVLSRIFIMFITTNIVFWGVKAIFDFENRGSYFYLFVIFILGGFSMISLGLLISARVSSEEFANGIMNIVTWPMMIFSEVWFSLEGTNPIIRKIAAFFPLTHLVDAARKVMNDGLGFYEIRYNLIMLLIMTALFLIFGSLLFKWHKT